MRKVTQFLEADVSIAPEATSSLYQSMERLLLIPVLGFRVFQLEC